MSAAAENARAAHVEAEQATLGALLLDSSAFSAVAKLLTSEDFSRPDHRLIFSAIAALDADGKPSDALIVAEYLDRAHCLDEAGGRAYLSQLARETLTPAYVLTYATYVRDHRGKSNGATFGSDKSWPDPVNLFSALGAPPFTAGDVPEALGAYPSLYAQQTGIDASIALTAAVASAAAAIPDQIQVCADSSSDWFAQPRLWLLVIAAPGAGKSPAQRAMIEPLWRLHSELDGEWRAATAALPEDEPKPPRPRVIVGDATLEALSDVLADNPRGVLVATDEFAAWLGTLDQYKSGGTGRDRGEWLRLFDGGPHSIERVRRGTVFVPNWGASILTATTPAAMQKFSRNLPEDGLIQRFLVVLAGRQKIVTAAPQRAEIEAERARYAQTLRRLWALVPRAHNGVVPLSAEAAERFAAWRSENLGLQEALGSLDSALEAHLAKHPTLALRLALTFHCARIVQLSDERARDPAAWPVPLETLEMALRFLRRASQHALAMYLGRKGGSEVYELARDVARFLLARGANENAKGLQRRDLIPRVASFRGADEAEQSAALRLLIDLSWLREAPGVYRKAGPTRFAVHPAAQEIFAATAERERAHRALARERVREAAEARRTNPETE